jgi:hypothetical protein
MKLLTRRNIITVLISLFFILPAAASVTPAQVTIAPLPNPVLIFTGAEYYETGGKAFIRYKYEVFNGDTYPNAIFAPAPTLPPCGLNTRSARTWVDIFDQRGKRLYGFCALGGNRDLNGLWFALPVDELPPSWIYIELNDRQTGTKYKSNLAETTM